MHISILNRRNAWKDFQGLILKIGLLLNAEIPNREINVNIASTANGRRISQSMPSSTNIEKLS